MSRSTRALRPSLWQALPEQAFIARINNLPRQSHVDMGQQGDRGNEKGRAGGAPLDVRKVQVSIGTGDRNLGHLTAPVGADRADFRRGLLDDFLTHRNAEQTALIHLDRLRDRIVMGAYKAQ